MASWSLVVKNGAATARALYRKAEQVTGCKAVQAPLAAEEFSTDSSDLMSALQ